MPTTQVTHPARRARRHRPTLVAALLVCAAVVATAAPAAADLPLLWRLLGLLTPPSSSSQTVVPAPAEPCGGSLNRIDGGTWECTFSDEFTASSLDRTTWVPQQTASSGFTSGSECYVDDPDNVSVTGGALRLTARQELATVSCGWSGNPTFKSRYTSGSVSTFDRWSQQYGRFEIRARFSASKVKGLQSALWLWPDNPVKYGPWPFSGEIDIAEVYSANNDRAIPFIHYATANPWDLSVTNNYCLLDPAGYHRYVAEWTPTSIRILYDGVLCLDHRIDPAAPLKAPAPFDQPFIIALTQALGRGANAFQPGVTQLPATTYVDYVRVWE